MKTVTTHYFLEWMPHLQWREFICGADPQNKEDVLKAYSLGCEENPTKKFRVIRKDVIKEVIAQSEDKRQALLSL